MIRRRALHIVCWTAVLFVLAGSGELLADPEEKIDGTARCAVCGMFVAKYENWIVQVRLADDSVMYFDGVKDMLVFYFNTGQYSSFQKTDISEIWVKDYYSLEWIDGSQALYVIGSDVYGPMGKEFISFSSREAAENFLKDHKGTEILGLEAIDDALVQSMRFGAKMKHGSN